ncbi:hypothetical protein MNBD_BACTEROID01-557 [hydrothermal vent metagenome]|uniref:Uncharacterized protein n=1 Tax=hydrothermal vent metagenome TaxID=652676 RepID=A0A3B0TN95_9ZZZZ
MQGKCLLQNMQGKMCIRLCSWILVLSINFLTELGYLITANEGMFAEQYVAQELLTIHQAYISPGLFYWSREEKKSMQIY